MLLTSAGVSMTDDKSGQPSFGLSVGVTSGLVNGCPLLSKEKLGVWDE